MLPHLAARLFGTPLLVHRAKLDVILSALGPRLGLGDSAPIALPEPLAAAYSANLPDAAAGIALIPIHGTLVKRTLGLEAASGLTSYLEIGALLDVDSPGSEASGSFELARRVREASQTKPVWAVANDAAFSAAYAIAAAAERLIVTETGGVGSIGVIALHIDQSVKDANDGYRYTAITAGRHKNDFSPHEPLADSARSELRAEVDRLYGLFVSHVSSVRGQPEDSVRATEAGLYFGPNALQAGLADHVGTLESTLADFSVYLSSRGSKLPPPRGLSRTRAAQHLESSMDNEPRDNIETIGMDQAAILVAQARREVTQSAQAIAEMCLIANCPDKAAGFIASGNSEAEVRQALMTLRAARSDASVIQSTITPDAGTQAVVRPEASPIVMAVKKLVGRE
jgi:ClpP class serine protease